MNDVRKTRPTTGNKYYIRRANGGYSGCIQGSPTDSQCNVLANCVGYANGAMNEQKGDGREVYPLTCNAENFIERGIAYGLSVYKNPEVGDCLVWQKGSTLSGSDGAGHVAICTDVLERNADGTSKVIITSESGYGSSKPFWRTQRTNANGKWGAGSGYTFRGCLRIPGYKPITVTPNVDKDVYKNQIEVKITDLRVRTDAGTDKTILGFASKGYYNFYETKDANGYKWYRIADGQWLASNDNWTTVYPAQSKPTPTYKYNIGDKVVINGQLYGNADGGNPGKTVSNRVTNITRIAEGHPYPYNTTGDLGWMAESSISPYSPTPTPTPTPTPIPTELKVGDTVKIVGGGRASSYGDKPVAGGIGWTRTILKIYKGRPYPNQVGNKTGTTGFYKDDALKKL